jgi:glycine betaine/proline transport system substrate-binding protein
MNPAQIRRSGRLALLVFGIILMLAGSAAAQDPIRIAYVEWSSEIASAHLVQAVLQEEMGVATDIIPMEADAMWNAVATGEADATVAAWLPDTHGHYLSEVEDQVANLGPNLKGARIGLVVPAARVGRQTMGSGLRTKSYVTVEEIPGLSDHREKFRGKIIGIDPAAGVMKKTQEAMEVYGLENFRLVSGSEVSMTAELSNAIRKQRWIVVTGWIPHWMFGRWNLKFLEDPENVYGTGEHISTIARKGLETDRPAVHAFLDRFQWTPEEMDQLMLWIKDDQGQFPYEKAERWIRFNREKVESWTR